MTARSTHEADVIALLSDVVTELREGRLLIDEQLRDRIQVLLRVVSDLNGAEDLFAGEQVKLTRTRDDLVALLPDDHPRRR